MYGLYEYIENNNEVSLTFNEFKHTCFKLCFEKDKNDNVRKFTLYDRKQKRNVMTFNSRLTKNKAIECDECCLDCKKYWSGVRVNLSIFDLENEKTMSVIKKIIESIEYIDVKLAEGGK